MEIRQIIALASAGDLKNTVYADIPENFAEPSPQQLVNINSIIGYIHLSLLDLQIGFNFNQKVLKRTKQELLNTTFIRLPESTLNIDNVFIGGSTRLPINQLNVAIDGVFTVSMLNHYTLQFHNVDRMSGDQVVVNYTTDIMEDFSLYDYLDISKIHLKGILQYIYFSAFAALGGDNLNRAMLHKANYDKIKSELLEHTADQRLDSSNTATMYLKGFV